MPDTDRCKTAVGKKHKHPPSPFAAEDSTIERCATAAGEVRRKVEWDRLRGTKSDRPRNIRIEEVHRVGEE